MCIAFEQGVEKMIPVSTVEEALEFRNNGLNYILAAERNGIPVKSFDFGYTLGKEDCCTYTGS